MFAVNMNAPCSPFLMITCFGPARHDPARGLHEVGILGELARFVVVEREQIDVLEELERSGRRLSIQKFIVSQATSFGFSTCVEHLELEARVDVAEEDERRASGTASGIFGRKSAKTPSCVSSVSAELRSWR